MPDTFRPLEWLTPGDEIIVQTRSGSVVLVSVEAIEGASRAKLGFNGPRQIPIRRSEINEPLADKARRLREEADRIDLVISNTARSRQDGQT